MGNINDVAKRANVSKSTVSYVLSNKKYVSPYVRERVLQACEELDFSSNFFAANLLTRKTNIIGLFLEPDNNRYYPFYNELIETCVLELKKRDIQVLLYFGQSCVQIERLMRSCATPIMGAIILTPVALDTRIQEFERDNVPFVLIGEPQKKHENLFSVDIDNAALAHKVFKYIYDKGHRNILFVNAAGNLMISMQREKAAEEFSACYSNVKIKTVHAQNDEGAAYGLLAGEKAWYTCVAVASDINARDVYRFYGEKGAVIGRDMSVIAFGGVGNSAFLPRLTGARQNYFRIAGAAVELLLKQFDDNGCGGEQVWIESDFVEGESVADTAVSLRAGA